MLLNRLGSFVISRVIPVKTGIQSIKKSCGAGLNKGFVRYEERMFLLDSRLRGNDKH
jgi:hypothetical protein